MTWAVSLGRGEALNGEQILERFPEDVYLSPAHQELCDRLATFVTVAPAMVPQLQNLLYLRSREARRLTALRLMIAEGEETGVRAITTPYDRRDLEYLLGVPLPTDVEIVRSRGVRGPTLDRSAVLRFCLRVGMHRLYRLLNMRRRPMKPTVIRTWVEVSRHLFGSEMPGATVLIYPFPINVQRHIRYIRARRELSSDVRFAGVPYRVRDVLSVLSRRGTRRVAALVRAEHRAYTRHGRELADAGAQRVLTSDEFEIGAWALHTTLRERGVYSVNGAHGAGMYAPRVAYDEFRVLSRAQVEFYTRLSPGTRYVGRAGLNSEVVFEPSPPYQPAIVFIHQHFPEPRRWAYELRAQAEVIDRLVRAGVELGVPVWVKAHPNAREDARRRIADRHGVAVFRQWSELPARHPIVVLLNSTIYFELVRNAPVLVVTDRYLTPEAYLGEGIMATPISDIGMAVAAIDSLEAWRNRVREQAFREDCVPTLTDS